METKEIGMERNEEQSKLEEQITSAHQESNQPLIISPIAYFKTMLSILYCSVSSPFTTTYIDFSTGNIVRED